MGYHGAHIAATAAAQRRRRLEEKEEEKGWFSLAMPPRNRVLQKT